METQITSAMASTLLARAEEPDHPHWNDWDSLKLFLLIGGILSLVFILGAWMSYFRRRTARRDAGAEVCEEIIMDEVSGRSRGGVAMPLPAARLPVVESNGASAGAGGAVQQGGFGEPPPAYEMVEVRPAVVKAERI